MRNKKYTKVTKENLHLIAHRVKQFLALHPCIVTQSEWDNINKVHNRLGMKDSHGEPNVERTCKNYIISDSCEIQERDNAIFLYPNSDTCKVIEIGDKIWFSSTNIRHKAKLGYKLNNYHTHTTSTWKPYSNIKKAQHRHDLDEAYAKAYWDSIDDDFYLGGLK